MSSTNQTKGLKTIKALVKELAKREGLKKQVDIAQITEIVGHLADIVDEEAKDSDTFYAMMLLHDHGYNRRVKREKKARKKKDG